MAEPLQSQLSQQYPVQDNLQLSSCTDLVPTGNNSEEVQELYRDSQGLVVHATDQSVCPQLHQPQFTRFIRPLFQYEIDSSFESLEVPPVPQYSGLLLIGSENASASEMLSASAADFASASSLSSFSRPSPDQTIAQCVQWPGVPRTSRSAGISPPRRQLLLQSVENLPGPFL